MVSACLRPACEWICCHARPAAHDECVRSGSPAPTLPCTQALAAWWADECATRQAAAGAGSTGAAGAADDEQAAGGRQGPAGSRPARGSTPAEQRQLRPRAAGQAAAAAGGKQVAKQCKVQAPLQPPVVLIQEAERCDMGELQDLVQLLVQVRVGTQARPGVGRCRMPRTSTLTPPDAQPVFGALCAVFCCRHGGGLVHSPRSAGA